MTIEISLTKGYTAIVDDEDADLAELKWWVLDRQSHTRHLPIYAARTQYIGDKTKTVFMHKVILERVLGYEVPAGCMADHIDNKSPLNNSRSNLRLATGKQNLCNRDMASTGTNPYKGIFFIRESKKRGDSWVAQIGVDNKRHYLGTFHDPLEGHLTYCIAALTYHKEFANFGDNSPFKGWTLEQLKKAVRVPVPVLAKVPAPVPAFKPRKTRGRAETYEPFVMPDSEWLK